MSKSVANNLSTSLHRYCRFNPVLLIASDPNIHLAADEASKYMRRDIKTNPRIYSDHLWGETEKRQRDEARSYFINEAVFIKEQRKRIRFYVTSSETSRTDMARMIDITAFVPTGKRGYITWGLYADEKGRRYLNITWFKYANVPPKNEKECADLLYGRKKKKDVLLDHYPIAEPDNSLIFYEVKDDDDGMTNCSFEPFGYDAETRDIVIGEFDAVIETAAGHVFDNDPHARSQLAFAKEIYAGMFDMLCDIELNSLLI